MVHRLLHQSHAAGGIGAIPARSAASHDGGEKVKAGGRKARPQPPKTLARFVILQDSARYPSGPRERSAKPPFVGSNPTRASNVFKHLVRFNLPMICTLIAQCLQLFHCLEGALGHVLDVVTLSCADAGMPQKAFGCERV